jgi:hypothetical protein
MKLFKKFRKKKNNQTREDLIDRITTNKTGSVFIPSEKRFKGNGGGP